MRGVHSESSKTIWEVSVLLCDPWLSLTGTWNLPTFFFIRSSITVLSFILFRLVYFLFPCLVSHMVHWVIDSVLSYWYMWEVFTDEHRLSGLFAQAKEGGTRLVVEPILGESKLTTMSQSSPQIGHISLSKVNDEKSDKDYSRYVWRVPATGVTWS